MEERQHPTHKKSWIILEASLLALAILPFSFGMYIHDPMVESQPLFDASVFLFMALMGGALVAHILCSHVSKCPECKGWMKRSPSTEAEDEKIRFFCKKCTVIFDTGINGHRD